MRKSIIVIEDFYEDPFAVRDYALDQQYYFPYEADAMVQTGQARVSWMTSWFKPAPECPFKSSQSLIGKLVEATGEQIDTEHWNLGFPITDEGKATWDCDEVPHSAFWNCSFHFKPDIGQLIGSGVHNHVTDGWNGVGDNGWAGLIYLSPDAPLRGGLRLWQNLDPARNYDWMTGRENWEMVDDLGNVFNRLLLCRGNLPHSGGNGWDDCIDKGRLYQTFFFRVKEPRLSSGVVLP